MLHVRWEVASWPTFNGERSLEGEAVAMRLDQSQGSHSELERSGMLEAALMPPQRGLIKYDRPIVAEPFNKEGTSRKVCQACVGGGVKERGAWGREHGGRQVLGHSAWGREHGGRGC